ncbi:amidohydrolase family protein [Glutamicibacter sp. 287]|uniref:amidohydrolase family protein n=1 Tax=Glutamicibacter sp. 287 TaxID=3457732 RepID=UPI004034EA53
MCEHDHNAGPVPNQALARRSVMAGAAALAGLGAFGFAAPASADSGERGGLAASYHGSALKTVPIIIEGGTLIDPATGDTVQDGVLVLRDGKVEAVGNHEATRNAVKDAAGQATRIDATGKFIIPGMVDAHVHANGLEDVRLILQSGATTVRSGSSTFYQDIALASLPKWNPGLSPRMHPAGLFVSPEQGDSILADPELAPLAALEDNIRDVKDLAYLTGVNLRRGATVIKTRANPRAGLAEQDPLELVYDREQLSAIVKAARGARVLCHAYSAKGIAGAVGAGVASIEHGVFVDEQTIGQMVRRGTAFTPTLAGVAGMANSSDPVIAERGREFGPVLAQAVRAANEAGVLVVAGTDSFGTDVMPIGVEAKALEDAGLSALQALQSVTTRPAKLIGVERQGVGQLFRKGVADVVILGSNPLEGAQALSKVEVVIAQGKIVRNELN